MKTSITITVDEAALPGLTDDYLVALWHAAQANPAPIEDRAAGLAAEAIGREIIRRFLANTPPELWAHQGRHAEWHELMVLKGHLPAPVAAPEAQA